MGAIAAMAAETLTEVFTASAPEAAATTAATETAATAESAAAASAAEAGASGPLWGTGSSATAGTAKAGSTLGALGANAAQGAGIAVVSSLLNPRPNAPSVSPVTGMPDPLAQQEARKQALAEQMARQGRASTIMTDAAPSGKLGG